jgi:hypothetical protein
MARKRGAKPEPILTQAALAAALRVSPQAVSRWVAVGLPRPQRGHPWDLVAVEEWRRARQADREAATVESQLAEAARQTAGLRRRDQVAAALGEQEFVARLAAGENARALMLEANGRFRFAKARASELELERLRGRLVDRAEAEDRVVDILRGLRALLLELPRRIDAELAEEIDVQGCRRRLEAAVVAVLELVQRQHGVDLPPRCPRCEELHSERSDARHRAAPAAAQDGTSRTSGADSAR